MAETTTFYTIDDFSKMRGWAAQKVRKFIRENTIGGMLPTNGKKGKGRAFTDEAIQMLAPYAALLVPGRTAAAAPAKAASKKVPKKRKVKKAMKKLVEAPSPLQAEDRARELSGEAKPPAATIREQLERVGGTLDALSNELSSLAGRIQVVENEIG